VPSDLRVGESLGDELERFEFVRGEVFERRLQMEGCGWASGEFADQCQAVIFGGL
jgi:hypothetical protein